MNDEDRAELERYRSIAEVIEEQALLHQALETALRCSAGFQKMLDELLAAIHRDGGQYTILVGHELSVKDALLKVQFLRSKR